MTNEQLAVLLNGYAEQLKTATQEADDALGEDVERESSWRYIGSASLLSAQRFVSNRIKDPGEWKEEKTGHVLALRPLWEMVESMAADIAALA